MDERVVISSGPLIAHARMDALKILAELPYKCFTPSEVHKELRSGPRDLLYDNFPASVEICELSLPRIDDLFDHLDLGEAAVIQLAISEKISLVCIDEVKGRRFAMQRGLRLMGSLGLLGRSKVLGIIDQISPFVARALASGIYYDARLVRTTLEQFGETWPE
ncbi:MAG: hypothetical protein WBO10_06205 [Pyrinomonadaceae bacterium]